MYICIHINYCNEIYRFIIHTYIYIYIMIIIITIIITENLQICP